MSSKTIEQRVLEMRFDNSHFERNVSNTMSTLEKLKQKLNFAGAAKGLDHINTATKNVNMSGLGSAVESISAKFSALQVMGVTALANITNSAVNAGKRIVSALTIDPIKSGFQEYETQINAVQTILANTSAKGTTIDEVNQALEELNKYADMTIYNFTEMTRNIGTFTAAGVDLETSVSAIQGIANLAAVSGSTSQQASTAMYQLSQALATGTVKLMDWNSVVNAGMGGEVFQNALKRTAENMGTNVDALIEKYGSFRDSLTQGEWITSEVLTKTLEQFTMAAEEGSAAWDEYKKSLMDDGYTEAQAVEILKMANTATDAATKVKTFTQLWDVMKESAQSGWSQTWKLIIGDFEEAKSLLTPIADLFTGFINTISNARNDLLESALGKGFTHLISSANLVKSGFDSLAKPIQSALTPINAVTAAVGDLGDIVDKVIYGSFGNGQERFDALTEAGYNYYRVQNKVNEKLGDSFRYTEEQIAAQDKLLGTQSDVTDKTKEQSNATVELTEANKKQLKSLVAMSDEQLRSAGYTEEQIKALRELERQAEKLGIPIDEFIDKLDEINGRWLLINSFKNIGRGLIDVFNAIKEAWVGVFPPRSLEERAQSLFDLIAGFHKLTSSLTGVIYENGKLTETGDNLVRTLKGLFAIIDIITTVTGGAFKVAFKIAKEILSYFNLDILDVTASIGDAIVKFRDFIDDTLDFGKAFDIIREPIIAVIEAIRDWAGTVDLKKVFESIREPIESAATAMRDWIESLKDSENLPEDIAKGIVSVIDKAIAFIKERIEWLRDGLKNGFNFEIAGINVDGLIQNIKNVFGVAGQVVIELGKIFLERLNNFLSANGLEEISIDSLLGLADGIREWIAGFKDAENIPKYIIEGLVNGLINGIPVVLDAAVKLARGLWEAFCDFMGIHSPSTKMIAAGEFTLEGLVIGLRNGASKVWDFIKGLGEKLLGFVNSIDFGKVLAVGLGAGILFVINKIADLVGAFSTPFEGIGEMLVGLGSMFDDIGKGIKSNLKAGALKKRSKAVLNFALAIGVLALALRAVSEIDPDRLWASVGAIAALAAIATAMSFAISKMGAIKSFGKQSLTLVVISGAILILAYALKVLAGIGLDDMTTEIMVLSAMILGIAAIMSVFSKMATGKDIKSIVKVGSMLLGMSVALLAMTLVIKMVSGMSGTDIAKGLLVIASFELLIMGIIAVSKLAGQHASKAGGMLLKMSVALLIMVGVIKLAAGLDDGEVRRGLKVVATLELLFAAIIAVSWLAGANASKAGTMLLMMSIALAVTLSVVKQASELDEDAIKRGIAVVGALELLFAAVIAVSRLAGQNAVKAGVMLLLMSGALAIMAGVMFILSTFEPDDLARSLAAVSILSLVFAVVIAATKNAGGVETGPLVTLVVAIGIMAVAVAALSFIDPTSLMTAAGSLTIMMGAFALMITSLTKLKGVEKVISKLLILTLVVTLLGGILGAMSLLPNPGNLLPAALSLSILMTALSASFLILSKLGPNASRAVGPSALMALVIGELAVVLAAMSFLPNTDSLMPIAISLSILLSALTTAMTVLGVIGPIATAAVGPAALMGLVIAELGAVLAALSFLPNVNSLLPTAKALSILLLALSAACLILIPVGMTGPTAIAGAGILAAVIAVLGAVAIAIGELMSYIPADKVTTWKTGIANFMDLLSTLAYGLGEVIGSFIGGFTAGAMSGLPEIGKLLSEFMTNAQGFIEGAKMVDTSVLTGAGILAGLILALTAVDLITGVTSFLTFGSSFADLGTELSNFMDNAQGFIEGASLLKPDMLNGVKTLAEVVMTLTAANILDGLTSWFTGGSSLETFGEQLAPLGKHLAQFASNLGTFGEDQIATINCAAQAIKAMATAAQGIPNEGGWLAAIVGDNSISTFGGYLPQLGTHLAAFATNLGTFGEEQIATVRCAADAIKAMAIAAQELPNEGGWLAAIVGDNSIATFGAYLPMLGLNLGAFATNLGTFDEAKVATVTCAADAIKAIAKAAEELPNEGGWLAAIVGDNSIATFGAYLPSLGTYLSSFATNLGTFDSAKVATVECAANAIKVIAAAAQNIPNEGGWLAKIFGDNGIGTFSENFGTLGSNLKLFCDNLGTFDSAKLETVETAISVVKALAKLANSDMSAADAVIDSFGTKLVTFGTNLATFCSSIADIGYVAVSSAIDHIENILDIIDSITSTDIDALSEFGESLKTLGSEGITKFVSAFTDSTSLAEVEKAAADLVKKAIDGIESKIPDIETAVDNMVDDAVDKIKSTSNYTDFYDAGKYLVIGFAAGINDNTYRATAKARAMAAAAAQAAEDELDINSPSKVFREIGSSIPEGFVQGIGKFGSDIKNAAVSMADVAIASVGRSISNLANIVNTDIDTQPTIRPVLDLSDVKSGAGFLNDMLSTNSKIGVMANVGVISSMMNRRSQTGVNDDVVAAIRAMDRHLDDVGGTQYNINGITYDDNSALYDAVQTIIRYAKIERRV